MTETNDNKVWHSDWKVWTDTKNETKARRVLARVESALACEFRDVTIEEYYKGGHVVRFRLDHVYSDWPRLVLEVIELGQRVGYGWVLDGDVVNDPSGLSNQLSVSGVTMMQFWIEKPWESEPRFDFDQGVRVRDNHDSDVAGCAGEIVGRAHQDGEWTYAVRIDAKQRVWSLNEDDLVALPTDGD